MSDVGLAGPVRSTRFGPYPFGLGEPFLVPQYSAFGALGFLGAAPVKFLGAKLLPNQSLRPSEGLQSNNGRVKVILQSDGNCVLYGDGQPLWWTGVRPGVNQAIMQSDGNFVLYKPDEGSVWASDTAGHPGAFLQLQDDANLVVYYGTPLTGIWSSETNGFRYYGGPGKPISLDDVVSVAGDVLAVAQVVVSFVPGVGAGINAAIAAGSALARGEPIGDALVEAAGNAFPGGPIAAQAFKSAVAAGKAIASGQNIGEAALAATRAALQSPEAQQAFDAGLAIVHGQNVQQALVNVTKSLAPEVAGAAASLFKQPELLNLPIAQVANLLHTTPAAVTQATAALNSNKALAPPATNKRLPPVLKAPPPIQPDPRLIANLAAVARKSPQAKDAEVLYVAVAANPELSTNANQLSPKLISNMIAVARKFPNAKDIEVLYIASLPPAPRKPPVITTGPVVASTPAPSVPPSVTAQRTYAPYPKIQSGTVSAPPRGHPGHAHPSVRHGHFGPVRRFAPWEPEIVTTIETCRTWGSPVDMSPGLATAAHAALHASGMQPTTARGPDGTVYLFVLENRTVTARPCIAAAVA